MYEYRQVIHRIRMGQSDRAIAKTGLMGRLKCGLVRAIAQERGWLGSGPLPESAKRGQANYAVMQQRGRRHPSGSQGLKGCFRLRGFQKPMEFSHRPACGEASVFAEAAPDKSAGRHIQTI